MDLKAHAREVGESLSKIVSKYDGAKGYVPFKKKEMDFTSSGKRCDWFYFYQLPSDSTMSVSFLLEVGEPFSYTVPGKTVSWGTRAQSIHTGNLELALKEFEERITEIPGELKTIYKSKHP